MKKPKEAPKELYIKLAPNPGDHTLVVDPGICFWALSVFNFLGEVVHTETFKWSSKETQDYRFYKIFDTLSTVAKLYPIDEFVIERQFDGIMIEIYGCLKTFAGSIGKTSFYFTPKQWKKIATGHGETSEEDLKLLVINLYPEFVDATEHQIDTVGIYLAHLKNKIDPPKPKAKKKRKSKEIIKIPKEKKAAKGAKVSKKGNEE